MLFLLFYLLSVVLLRSFSISMFDNCNYRTLEFQTKTEAEKPPFVSVSDSDYSTKTMLWTCTFSDSFLKLPAFQS